MQAHEAAAGLINPDGVEGIELVEGSLLSAPGSVRSLFPLLHWFGCKRGGSECKGGQGGTVMHCLGVHPDLGFGFGVRVSESGVGLDRASASRLLRQLDFRVRYLVIGRGHVVGHDGEAVDSDEGDGHE